MEEEPEVGPLIDIVNNTKLWEDFDSVVSRAGRCTTVTAEELKLTTAAMSALLLFKSAQRPSTVTGLTLEEVDRRRAVDDVWVLSVASHKISAQGPARLTLDDDGVQRLLAYIANVRIQLDPAVEQEKVFLQQDLSPMTTKAIYILHR